MDFAAENTILIAGFFQLGTGDLSQSLPAVFIFTQSEGSTYLFGCFLARSRWSRSPLHSHLPLLACQHLRVSFTLLPFPEHLFCEHSRVRIDSLVHVILLLNSISVSNRIT